MGPNIAKPLLKELFYIISIPIEAPTQSNSQLLIKSVTVKKQVLFVTCDFR